MVLKFENLRYYGKYNTNGTTSKNRLKNLIRKKYI